MNAFDVVAAKLDAAVREERLLAGAVGLIAGARVIGVTAAGVTRLGGPEVGLDTLFGVGSITKLFSALAAVRLAESGILRLDVPVVELVPGLSFDDTEKGGRVTVRHVLTHSSGLPAAGRDWGPPDEGSLRRFAEADLARHRFHATPGVIPCYSSTAFSLAGLAMQVATGKSFVDVLSNEVLDPAGTTKAGFPKLVTEADVAGRSRDRMMAGSPNRGWPTTLRAIRRGSSWHRSPISPTSPTGSWERPPRWKP